MEVKDFCSFLYELREKQTSRLDMERKYPWHRNTLKGYEKDRLPDVDYLYALSVETGFDFKELITLRLKAGMLNSLFKFHVETVFGDVSIEKSKSREYVINDDSMSPTIVNGAVITVDDSELSLKQDKIFAFKLNGNVTARRVQFGLENEIILIADSPSLINLTVPFLDINKLHLIGRVTGVLNPL